MHFTARVRRRPFHLRAPHRRIHPHLLSSVTPPRSSCLVFRPHLPTPFCHTSRHSLLGQLSLGPLFLGPTVPPSATPHDSPSLSLDWLKPASLALCGRHAFGNYRSAGLLVRHMVAWRRLSCCHISTVLLANNKTSICTSTNALLVPWEAGRRRVGGGVQRVLPPLRLEPRCCRWLAPARARARASHLHGQGVSHLWSQPGT